MTVVIARAGHWAVSAVYIVPFILFFWLVWRERARSRRAVQAVGAGDQQDRREPAGREPATTEPR
jgi:hypothetical protein